MTATTTTLPASKPLRDQRPLWNRLALMLAGAAMGITATLLISDGDDAPARSATSADVSNRSAVAADADRYVESLERRAASVSDVGVRQSADAAERWAASVPAGEVRQSADAAERWVSTESSSLDYSQPGAYAHGFSYADLDG